MRTPRMLPEKIPLLEVAIGEHQGAGQLLKHSIYEFRYLSAEPRQPAVALLMPARSQLTWQAGDLFPTHGPEPARGRSVHAHPRVVPETTDHADAPAGADWRQWHWSSRRLQQTKNDERIPAALHSAMSQAWETGLAYAR